MIRRPPRSTLSLHDALPIFARGGQVAPVRDALARHAGELRGPLGALRRRADRKSTRLNSSHMSISYAVFCLKKKKTSGVLSQSLFESQSENRLTSQPLAMQG